MKPQNQYGEHNLLSIWCSVHEKYHNHISYQHHIQRSTYLHSKLVCVQNTDEINKRASK